MPIRDADAMTTVPGLYAIGDCAGLGGAPAAREEGIIAAVAAGGRLGGVPAGMAAAADAARVAWRDIATSSTPFGAYLPHPVSDCRWPMPTRWSAAARK